MSYEIPSVTESWRELQEQYGRLTIAETMTSGTSTVALAQLVSARAAFQMLTKVDTRNFCRIENVPPGGGTTYHVQFIPVADNAAAVTEASGLASSSDYVPQDKTVTLRAYGVRTDLTDLLQRQAAINFADAVGKAHGNGILKAINAAVYTAIIANTTSQVTISGSGAQEVAWSDLLTAMEKVESQKGEPDTIITAPKKLHELMRKDVASQIYVGAYVDYLRTGRVNTLAGMAVYADANFKANTWSGASGEEYMMVLQSDEAVAWAQMWDISTEIQRYAELIGFKMVSSLGGGTAVIVEPFIASIEHV